jgi:hypothetical protein
MQRRPLVVELIAKGMTAGQIADQLDVNPETVRKFARKRGYVIQREPMTMEHHPSWSGGTVVDRSGYLLRRVAVAGPHGYLIRAVQKRGYLGTDPNGYAPEHRIVMHEKLGRPLQPGEVVDHIDGEVRNNDPANLRVFASNAEHLRETLKGRVPNWTPEGWARMCEPRGSRKDGTPTPDAMPSQSRTDDQASLSQSDHCPE